MLLVGPLAKDNCICNLHKVKAHDKRWAEDFSDFWNHGSIHGNLYVVLWLVYNGQSVTLSSYGRAWLTNVIMALPLIF